MESDCTQIDYSVAKNAFNSFQVKKIILPEVTSIFGIMFANTNGFFDVEIYTPKLTSVSGSGNNCPYFCVKNVIIPNSVRVIGTHVCSLNDTITLNCNRATINSSWCISAPKTNFTMCSDWQASINIAVAAKNRPIDWFIDLFTNKLADMTGQDAPQINIPLAIFEALSPEQLAIAQNKNWTVTGL